MAPVFPFRRPTAFIRPSSRPSIASRDTMPRPVGVSTPVVDRSIWCRPVRACPRRRPTPAAPCAVFDCHLTEAPRVTASAPWPDADPRAPTAVRPRWRRGSLSVSPAPIARSRPTAAGRRACSRRSSPSCRPFRLVAVTTDRYRRILHRRDLTPARRAAPATGPSCGPATPAREREPPPSVGGPSTAWAGSGAARPTR